MLRYGFSTYSIEQLEKKYNPRHDPDIFFLIDKQGNIVKKANALGVHMDEIMAFAKASAVN